MGNTAGKFDDLQTALNVALGVRNHFAVFRRQKFRELVHICFQQFLEPEHDARAPLRVCGGPFGLGGQRSLHGFVKVSRRAHANLRLHLPCAGVENIAGARVASGLVRAGNKMVNLSHNNLPSPVT